jgi:hypothetical protein
MRGAHLAAEVERGSDLRMPYDNPIPAGEKGNQMRQVGACQE